MLIRNPSALGHLIRDRRRQLHLTQSELAQKIGVSRFWVYQVEHGKSTANVGSVMAALQQLGLDIEIRIPKEYPTSPSDIPSESESSGRIPLTRHGKSLRARRGKFKK
jgi:HTH-type transcriptional regulator/antitoxin HipB